MFVMTSGGALVNLDNTVHIEIRNISNLFELRATVISEVDWFISLATSTNSRDLELKLKNLATAISEGKTFFSFA